MESRAPKLFTAAEVAAILRLADKQVKDPCESVRYLVRSGRLKAVRICGRLLFTEADVAAYIESCRN